MYAGVKWNGGMAFTGSAQTGFEVKLDAHPDVGGENDGFRPLELMGVSLAGCTAMDVISILKKKRQDVSGFEVQVDVERADDHPHVFTKIDIKYIVTGKDIDPAALERAIELSQTRYCSASAMLAEAAPIHTTYEIVEA